MYVSVPGHFISSPSNSLGTIVLLYLSTCMCSGLVIIINDIRKNNVPDVEMGDFLKQEVTGHVTSSSPDVLIAFSDIYT